jgi:hypothetical protein
MEVILFSYLAESQSIAIHFIPWLRFKFKTELSDFTGFYISDYYNFRADVLFFSIEKVGNQS